MSWNDLQIEIPRNLIDISTFIKQFKLKDCFIENIGYEFYNDQIVMTINCPYQLLQLENQCNREQTSVNFIFEKVKEIDVKPEQFTLKSNKIIEIIHSQSKDSDKVTFMFQADEGIIEFSFNTKEVEYDSLNPYLI